MQARGVPFLNAFTGAHAEYHTPRDTPEKINYEGAARIAQFMAAAVEDLASRAEPPPYTPAPKPREAASGAGLLFTVTYFAVSGSKYENANCGVAVCLLSGITIIVNVFVPDVPRSSSGLKSDLGG